jgi:hypothetical protein
MSFPGSAGSCWDADTWAADTWDEDAWAGAGEPGGGAPGQEGELDASDRLVRTSGAITHIRRASFVLAFLLLGVL